MMSPEIERLINDWVRDGKIQHHEADQLKFLISELVEKEAREAHCSAAAVIGTADN
jgi:hypothetical protein